MFFPSLDATGLRQREMGSGHYLSHRSLFVTFLRETNNFHVNLCDVVHY